MMGKLLFWGSSGLHLPLSTKGSYIPTYGSHMQKLLRLSVLSFSYIAKMNKDAGISSCF